MISFRRAPTVRPGDRISSAQHNALAEAFNDRLLSGAGDAAWRIFWNALSLTRQVRNPDGDFLVPGAAAWPAKDEWFKLYGLVDNSNTCAVDNGWFWPIEPPGQPQGANVSNPLMLSVHGNAGANIEGEAARLTDGPSDDRTNFVPIDVATMPQAGTNPDIETVWTTALWEHSKLQRGWVSTAPPYPALTPAYEAARSIYSLRYGGVTPYLAHYSAFAPVPPASGSCPVAEGGPRIPAWRAVFTPLVPGYPVLAFPTCPGVSGHLQFTSRQRDRYVLYFQDAPPVMLPYSVYMEGPYNAGGGALAREHSELLTLALNRFVAGMRGTPAERASSAFRIENGFDFNRFLSSQYALAPAVTSRPPSSPTQPLVDYPEFKLAVTGPVTVTADTPVFLTGSHTMVWFGVLSAFMVESENLQEDVVIAVTDAAGTPLPLGRSADPCEATVPAILDLTVPATRELNKVSQRMIYLHTPVNPGVVKVRLMSSVSPMTLPTGGNAAGRIRVELLEQVRYQPDMQDAYAMLRCAFATKDSDEPDKTGDQIVQADLAAFNENWFKYGCIYAAYGATNVAQHPTAVNFNGIHESARRLLNDNLRLADRASLESAAYDGDTTLYFRRSPRPGKNDDGGTLLTETVVRSRPVSVDQGLVAVTEALPGVEHVIRLDVPDNLRTVPSVLSAATVSTTLQHPVRVYPEQVAGGSSEILQCDAYVLYANEKFVPPGYYEAFNGANTTSRVPDADERFPHVLVGLTPPDNAAVAGRPVGKEMYLLVPDVEIRQAVNHSFETTRTFVDPTGTPRTEVVRAARVSWVPRTRFRFLDTDGIEKWAYDYQARLLHAPGENARGADQPSLGAGGDTRFPANHGWRYIVQGRYRADAAAAWSAWRDLATAPAGSAIPDSQTYGFDALSRLSGTRAPGALTFDDPDGFGRSGATVEYRIWGRPVLDINHPSVRVLRRAAMVPRLVTVTNLDPARRTVIRRHWWRRTYHAGTGRPGALEQVISSISDQLTGGASQQVIDLAHDLVPAWITGWDPLAQTGAYAENEGIISYDAVDVVPGSAPVPASATLMAVEIRPDNIQPTADADLSGDGTGSAASGLTYRVRGSTDLPGGSEPHFQYVDPAPGNNTAAPDETLRVGLNKLFAWKKKFNNTLPLVLDGYSYHSPERVVKEGGVFRTALVQAEQVEITQYAWSLTDTVVTGGPNGTGDTGALVIENTAGVTRGEFTGIFFPRLNRPNQLAGLWTLTRDNEVSDAPGAWFMPARPAIPDLWELVPAPADGVTVADNFMVTRWSGWEATAVGTLESGKASWYLRRTGYEKAWVQVIFAPGPGEYGVRGPGYITYENARYFSGQTVTILAGKLMYTASDAGMRLVTTSTVSCTTTLFELFAGIAPVVPVADFFKLVPGRLYRVHRAKTDQTPVVIIHADGRRTSQLPNKDFAWPDDATGIDRNSLSTADAVGIVREVEGIKPNPTTLGSEEMTNEWCVFLQTSHYHPSNSSMWKPENYSDQAAVLHNRCHTGSFEFRPPRRPDLHRHFIAGTEQAFISEAPPGYTYLLGTNSPARVWSGSDAAATAARRNYYESCQVYRAPYRLKSAQIHYVQNPDGSWNDGTVKITIHGRLQHAPGAPSAWNTAADVANRTSFYAGMQTETRRTDENAVREYVVHRNTGGENLKGTGYQCRQGLPGDSAGTYDIFAVPDNPFGACYPRFHFVRLIPRALVHNPGTPDCVKGKKLDAPMTVDPYSQMDMYLRAMCGGFMDRESFKAAGCTQDLATSPFGDYLYRNLIYQTSRTDGATLPVIPITRNGSYHTPFNALLEFTMNYDAVLPGTPIIIEFRAWNPGTCSFDGWVRLGGQTVHDGAAPPVGGEGYSAGKVKVTFEGATSAGSHKPAEAVAEVAAPLKIDSISIVAGGSGYANVTLVLDGGNPVIPAEISAVLDGGSIIGVTVDVPGHYLTVPTIRVLDLNPDGNAAGSGANLEAVMVPIAGGTGPIRAITVTNPGDNWGYLEVPQVVIEPVADGGGDGGGDGAYAVARVEPNPGSNTWAVVGADLLPEPTGGVSHLTFAHPDGVMYPVQLRFSDARDWRNGETPGRFLPVVTTQQLSITFNFIRGRTYRLQRNVLPASRCAEGFDLNAFAPTDNIITPECSANLGHANYDACQDACACLLVVEDPAFHQDGDLPAGSPAGIGLIVEDLTDATTTAYLLGWDQTPRTVYNVERRINYDYGWGPWVTLAEDVRPFWLDNVPVPTSFSEEIEPTVERTLAVVTTVKVSGDPVPDVRSIPFTGQKADKTLLLDCVVTARYTFTPPRTDPDVAPVPVTETVTSSLPRIALSSGTGSGMLVDRRSPAPWLPPGAVVTHYDYTVQTVSGVTVRWPNVEQHQTLAANHATSGLSYTLTRTVEDFPDNITEVVGRSVPPGGTVTKADWPLVVSATETVLLLNDANTVHLGYRLSDARTNRPPTGYQEASDDTAGEDPDPAAGGADLPANQLFGDQPETSERWRVTAVWTAKATPVPLQLPDSRCDPDSTVTRTTDREYRVRARADARFRWSTTVPAAINYERPEGPGPLSNTCSFAETFNNLARAVNALTACRLDLPFVWRSRSGFGDSLPDDAVTCDTDGNSIGCNQGDLIENMCFGGAGIDGWSPWSYDGLAGASGAAGYSFSNMVRPGSNCDEVRLPMSTIQVTQVELDPNREYMLALPAALRGNFGGTNVAMLGTTTITTFRPSTFITDDVNFDAARCAKGDDACKWRRPGGGFLGFSSSETKETFCSSFSGGTVSPPSPPCGPASWLSFRNRLGMPSTCPLGGGSASVVVKGLRTQAYLSFPLR